MEHMTTRIDYRQEFAHLPFSIKAVIHTVFDQTFKQRVCAADNDNVMFIWVKEGELELSLMQGFFYCTAIISAIFFRMRIICCAAEPQAGFTLWPSMARWRLRF